MKVIMSAATFPCNVNTANELHETSRTRIVRTHFSHKTLVLISRWEKITSASCLSAICATATEWSSVFLNNPNKVLRFWILPRGEMRCMTEKCGIYLYWDIYCLWLVFGLSEISFCVTRGGRRTRQKEDVSLFFIFSTLSTHTVEIKPTKNDAVLSTWR